MNIEKFEIGDNKPVFITADIGLCHNGSLDIAKDLIDVAVKARANAVKFQKRDVDNLVIPEVLDAPNNRFPSFGKTYREIRKKIEFGEKEYDEIFQYCAKKNILVFSTPFDINSLNFLKKYEPPVVKVASHSVTNLPLLEGLTGWDKPIILSTGMCTFDELDDAVDILKNVPFALLHCVSSYPTGPSEANLKMIDVLKEKYKAPVGLSTHEIGFLASLAGVARGANILERHITLDHDMEGFDHKIALTPEELEEMIQKVREIESMLIFHEKKISENEMVTRKKYQISAVAGFDISKGTKLKEEYLVFKNPGTGLTPKQITYYFGRTLNKDIKKDEIILPEMFEKI